MRRKFVLPIKGLSINNTYYGNAAHGMKPEAQDWFRTATHVLNRPENSAGLKELREAFKPNKHAYFFHIRAFIPKEFYYTKEGKLSRRSFDVSNFEKSILDVFCLDKYAGNLQTDDCVVKGQTSIKLPSPDNTWKIEVTIRIVKN